MNDCAVLYNGLFDDNLSDDLEKTAAVASDFVGWRVAEQTVKTVLSYS